VKCVRDAVSIVEQMLFDEEREGAAETSAS
jgi:hypothetical protein